MEKRPKLKLSYSIYEIVIEIVSIITIITGIGLLLKYYSLLPSIIPSHFDAAGVPNRYGSKSYLFILPIITFIMYFSLTILSRFPNIYNYPEPITEENVEYQYRCARKLIIIIKTEIVICFTYIEWISIKAALEKSSGLGLWFLPVFIIVVFGTLIIYIKKSLR